MALFLDEIKMVKDDELKSVGGSSADGNVGESVEKVADDADRVVKQQALETGASPAADEAQEGEQEASVDGLRTLEEELDKISALVPTLYIAFVCISAYD